MFQVLTDAEIQSLTPTEYSALQHDINRTAELRDQAVAEVGRLNMRLMALRTLRRLIQEGRKRTLKEE